VASNIGLLPGFNDTIALVHGFKMKIGVTQKGGVYF
jgi:hypothetical protein